MTQKTRIGLGRLWKEQLELNNDTPRLDGITKDHSYIHEYIKWKKENPDKNVILIRRNPKRKIKEHWEIIEEEKPKEEKVSKKKVK